VRIRAVLAVFAVASLLGPEALPADASLLGPGAPAADAAAPSWYPAMRWIPAAAQNFEVGRAGNKITHIVIHATDGRYAGTLAWFQDPRADLSAHYVIRASDGEITQAVTEGDTAFHARGFNRQSIGIEHEFDPSAGIGYTQAAYRSSATLVCAIARRYGIPLDRTHVIGHNEVPKTDHSDPGPTWDWTYYMSLVRSCGGGVAVSTGAPAFAVCDARPCRPEAGLSAGDDGPRVAQLQWALVYLGRLAKDDLAGGVGHFGPRTLGAVREFQTANGVPATGFYGDLTAAALAEALAARPSAAPAADLSFGAESAEVTKLQTALRARGYMDLVTGYFGPLTRDAVQRFQSDHLVAPTGTYGPLTRAALSLDLR
jgi:N-acetyl-anhydromuramyl-L-alanine amidase AmpD